MKLALWSENVAAEAIAEHIVRAAEFEMSSKQIVSGNFGAGPEGNWVCNQLTVYYLYLEN